MLNLNNVVDNWTQLIEKYNLVIVNNHVLFDGDAEEMLSNSGIEIRKTIQKVIDWAYGDVDDYLIGCSNGDYLESIELFQNGNTYICQAFSDWCGDGLDYTIALLNVRKV